MRDTVARFGSFAGIDANGRGKDVNSAFWASIATAPPMGQRDQWVDAREIPAVGSPGGSTLADVETFFARPEWQNILSRTGLSLINNCELEVKDPIKGTTGSDAVIGVGTVGTGDDALVWHDTDKPRNGRWSLSVIANAYPGAAPFTVLLPGNEPDGCCNRYCAYAPTGVGLTIDNFSNVGKLDRTTVLTRLATMLRHAWEELKTEQRLFTTHKFGGVVPCYANTGVAMQNLNLPGGINYSLYHFFNHNNGEMLRYCNVIANHFHNSASVFDTTGVPNNQISPWHLWTALQQGQAAAGTGATHPLYCNEGGVVVSNFPLNLPPAGAGATAGQQTTWNRPPTEANELARRLLKVRRTGMMACTIFYWSYSFWVLYNQNGSPDDGVVWCPANEGYTPREPSWTSVRYLFDPENYVLTGRQPWPLTINAKPLGRSDGHDYASDDRVPCPSTWAVLGDLHQKEKADPASPTERTWYEWDRATITDNHITFTAPVAGQGNQLNRAMRPVIFPGHGRYKVTCAFSGNTGTVRLIARGYNAVNGLESTTASSTSSSGTLSATFTTVPHDVKHFPTCRKSPWF